jgi:hypothetical protein
MIDLEKALVRAEARIVELERRIKAINAICLSHDELEKQGLGGTVPLVLYLGEADRAVLIETFKQVHPKLVEKKL